MHITDLSIENFGPHTNWEPGAGGIPQGLAVIHGPNEAGKSAIRAFIRMVLFGRMRANAARAGYFNYSHARGSAGAGSVSVRLRDGRQYTFHRMEGRQPTVTGDEAGGEELLLRLIGRIDSALYQNVFSISLTELQFGETLGDRALRDRIYSAGLGLGGVSLPDAIKRLEDERSAPRGLWSERAGVLRKNLAALMQARLELRQAVEELAGYEGLTGEIAELRSQVESLGSRLKSARERAQRLQNINELRAPAERQLAITERLSSLPDEGPFPEDGLGRLEKLKVAVNTVREKIATIDAEAAKATAALEKSGAVDAFLEAESGIIRLLSEQESYALSVRDLPDIQRKGEMAGREISDGLASLGDGWDEARLASFTDRRGAARSVNSAAEKLRGAGTEVTACRERLRQAVERADEAAEAKSTARRAVERIANIPDEDADDLRARRARVERLRAAIVELAQAQRPGAAGVPGRRSGLVGAITALFRVAWALIGRVFPFLRSARQVAEDAGPARAAGAVTASDVESEVRGLADSLGIGAGVNERELVEMLSEADGAIRRRELFDGRQAALEEAAARRERMAGVAASARAALAAAEKSLETARSKWADCLSSLNLAAALDPSAANSALLDLEALRGKLESAQSLRGRAAAMRAQASSVEERLAPILASAGMKGFEPHSAASAMGELDRRFRAHKDAVARSEALAQQLKSWDEQRHTLGDELERLEVEIAALIAAAGCRDEELFRSRAAVIASRDELEHELQQIEKDHPSLSARGEGSLIAEIQSSTLGNVEAERQEADDEARRLEEEDGRLREELGALNNRREQAESSNPTAPIQAEIDRLEQLVGEQAGRWGVLTVARQILNAAREEYQSKRQAPLMRSASEHFQRFTCSAYRAVEAIMGEDEIQVVESTGRVKNVVELSRGTAEQLYLAMRFAFIDEYTQHSEPVPVLMDDVMVNFDAVRARSACDAIVEFSRSHQVLLLTCHEPTVAQLQEAAREAGATPPAVIRL